MENLINYYQILGLSYYATIEEIKEAYRNKVKEVHPDKKYGDSDLFKLVKEAYDVLQNDEKRKRYDDILFKSININVVSKIVNNQQQGTSFKSTPAPKSKERNNNWKNIAVMSLVLNICILCFGIWSFQYFGNKNESSNNDNQILDQRLTDVINENTDLKNKNQELKDKVAGLTADNEELRKQNVTIAANSDSVENNNGYFTIGSTKEQVRAVMGTPSSVSDHFWMYDFSMVNFDSQGSVSGYSNTSKNLKVK
jgi:DnaJ-class molecular chaperone